ncbi:MAG: hypothetical protein LEGION0403_FIIPPAGN_00788 [Legionella sp.]
MKDAVRDDVHSPASKYAISLIKEIVNTFVRLFANYYNLCGFDS